jgi:hypothetical protein
MPQPLSTLVILISYVLLSACSGIESRQNQSNETKPVLPESDTSNLVAFDSAQLSKRELTTLYMKAIGDFMQMIYQKDSLVFDTLFLGERKFGTEDDFPDISLPERIGNTNMAMVSIGEAHGAKKRVFKKTSPFINLMGWVNKTNAEFIFITFYPEFIHQYDAYLNYTLHPTKKEFELKEERLEVLKTGEGNKTSHYAIYKKGIYIGDKAIH